MACASQTLFPPTIGIPTALFPEEKALTPKSELPSVSYASPDLEDTLKALQDAATTVGVAAVKDLPFHPPFTAIQALFDRLHNDPVLAAEVNATYPLRGVYKNACLTKPSADQKFTLDFSRVRLARFPTSLKQKLGETFVEVIRFLENIHTHLVPLLLSATSSIVGSDLTALHSEENVNYRLCDYPTSMGQLAPRCGQHRDYGTVTILFQDGQPGLEYEVDGAWVLARGDEVLIIWGWCAHVLSGGSIHPAAHRVLKTAETMRRISMVMFVAPDLAVPLTPVVKDPLVEFTKCVLDGDLSVGDFKAIMGRKWRYREGNEDDDGSHGDQDTAIKQLLRK